jgi:hypothetical protein
MHTDETRINQLSERIIGCAFRVMNTLGAGFLEQPYENALARELRKSGLAVAQQVDLLIEETVMVELKLVKALDDVHAAQCINYLTATGLQLCLLLNFGKSRIEIGRFAHGL